MKTKKSLFFWIPALLLLTAVLIFVNLQTKPRLPEGAREGDLLPDFSVTCVDGSEFRLSAQQGKVVVINLWATWCTPCVRELPDFDRFAPEHPADVAVLALHGLPVTADVEEYLSAFGYAIPFAVDTDGGVSGLLGATDVLPQTVIVRPDGVVAYNRAGALSYEKLSALVEAAMKMNNN